MCGLMAGRTSHRLGAAKRDKRLAAVVGAALVLRHRELTELFVGYLVAQWICGLPAHEQTCEWIKFSSECTR
jgi:hypothetical protein